MSKANLLKSSFVYVIASIFVQAINVLLIPIYTRNFTSEEYGLYVIIASIQNLLIIFAALGVFSGLSRFFYDYNNKNQIKNLVLSFSLVWSAVIGFLGIITAPAFASFAFGGYADGLHYTYFIIGNSILLCFISIYTAFYNMDNKPLKTGIINTGKLLLVLFLTIYLITILEQGIIGALKAQFTAYALVAALLLLMDRKNLKFILNKKQLKQIVSYGAGLVPGQAAVWVLTLIDRYFLQAMVNLSTVAVYSLGYNIGMLIKPIFLLPFSTAFTPFKYKVYKDEDGKGQLREQFKYYSFIGWFLITGISLYANIGIKVLATAEYGEAFKIVPLIVFSYFLWGLEQFYGLGLHIAKKMSVNSMIIMVGALFNILLNIIFIPVMGMYGAAAATIISYIIINILYYLAGKQYYDLGISLWEPYKYCPVFLFIYGAYFFLGIYSTAFYVEFAANMILIALYLFLVVSMKIMPYCEFQKIFALLKKTVKKEKNLSI
ncbi:oligosaccharide flippase family protein [Candidatus Contubernalis alkaliaceticus]|uniref:oligosaccharide flippase family protein n=1 Tax=Candidatus Contubernalis alkaliaceticus TaxID=338645 RepID=UPI001F4BD1F7|nr:oligosaccharide flippase family protein [Candidatus Contubernalis alkalaceticus]UNC93610.1 polysaccharide biosynthesis protein [Candidatus Contubernalis alkalaceticus]